MASVCSRTKDVAILTYFLSKPPFPHRPLLLRMAPPLLPQALPTNPCVITPQAVSSSPSAASVQVSPLPYWLPSGLLAVPCLPLALASPGLQCSQTLSKMCIFCLYTFHGSPMLTVHIPAGCCFSFQPCSPSPHPCYVIPSDCELCKLHSLFLGLRFHPISFSLSPQPRDRHLLSLQDFA